jgi:glycosyltransferase involved in cell wall biosynthesis
VEKKLPKITIVTVTYNCENVIENTIKSVVNQTYPNIEYLIIDGKSKDRTLEIVEKYKDKIDKVVCEKDRNNYDAMNKGMRHASGDYIWFLHAGDIAESPTVLEEAFSNHNDEDFVYGKVKIIDENNQVIPWHKKHPDAKNLSWKSFRNGMIICHQAMLPHRRIWEEYRYEEYKLVADLDWTIRILKKAKTYRDTGITLCSFLKGGISAKHRKASWKERFAILKKHFGLIPTLWEHLIIVGQAIRRGNVAP